MLILQYKTGTGTIDPNGQLYLMDQNTDCEGVAMDGNTLIVVGTSSAGGAPAYVASVKTDGTGGINWQKTVASSTFDDVVTDDSGNMFVCGTATGDGGLVAKINAGGGSFAWQKAWDNETTGSSTNYGINLDSSGNVIVVGVDTNASNRRGIIRKYNSSGTLQWEKYIIAAAQTPYGNHVDTDASGNIYVTYANHSYQQFIVKFNSSGTMQWRKQLSWTSGGSHRTAGIAVADSGAVYVSGTVQISSNRDMSLTKLDSSGTVTWSRRIGDGSLDEGTGTIHGRYNIALDDSENIYYVAEGQKSGGDSWSRAYIFKYNSSGTIQWQRAITHPTVAKTSYAYEIVVKNDTFMVVGETNLIPGAMVFKGPTDGTDTGTYGAYTYDDPSLTEQAAAGATSTERTEFTEGTSSYAEATTSLTLGAVSNSFTVYNKT